jgi:hypothetical protein
MTTKRGYILIREVDEHYEATSVHSSAECALDSVSLLDGSTYYGPFVVNIDKEKAFVIGQYHADKLGFIAKWLGKIIG